MTRGLVQEVVLVNYGTASYDSAWWPLNSGYETIEIESVNISERAMVGLEFSSDKVTIDDIYMQPSGGIGVPHKIIVPLASRVSSLYFRLHIEDIGLEPSQQAPPPYQVSVKVFWNSVAIYAPQYNSYLSFIGDISTGVTGDWVNTTQISKIRVSGTESSAFNLTATYEWSENTVDVLAVDVFTITTASNNSITLLPKATFVRHVLTSTGNPTESSLNAFFFALGGSGSDVNVLTNIGGGSEVYVDSTDGELRTLTSTGGSVTITQGASTINLEYAGGTETLQDVLTAGNASGGLDINLTSGSEIISSDGNVILNASGSSGTGHIILEPKTSTGKVHIIGNLDVDGTTTSVDYSTMNVENSAIILNSNYTSAVAKPFYVVGNYLPVAGAQAIINGGWVAGDGFLNGPQVSTDLSYGGWVPGDCCIVVGSSADNDGLYEIDSYSGGTGIIIFRGQGLVGNTFNFFRSQVNTSAFDLATITKVTLSGIRCNAAGVFQAGKGSNTSSITFENISPSLASAGGTSIVKTGTGASLENKGLTAGAGISLTPNTDDVTITNTSLNTDVTLSSAGGTESLVTDGSGPSLAIKGLTSGSNIALGASATGLTINSTLDLFYNAFPKNFADVTSITGLNSSIEQWTGGVLAPNGKIYWVPCDSTVVAIFDPATKTIDTSAITGLSASTRKWAGGVLAPNGKIYCIPRNDTSVLVIDPILNTTSTITGLPVDTEKWIGGVLAPNGKIYGIPHSSTTVLIIDPIAGTADTATITGLSGSTKWSGGVLAPNGKIYGIPFSSTSVLIIDPVAGTADTTTITGVSGNWVGGVLATNGKIYGVPRSATTVIIIDPIAGTADTATITGLAAGQKYHGGVLGPNGYIYCCPFDATNVLIINPSTDTKDTTTITGLNGANSKWWGGVLAPNGKICVIPLRSTTGLIINTDIQSVNSSFCLSAYNNKF